MKLRTDMLRTEIDNDALMVVVYVPELDVKHIVKAVDVILPSMYDAMVKNTTTQTWLLILLC